MNSIPADTKYLLVKHLEGHVAHIVPHGDDVAHELSEDCPCGPRLESVVSGCALWFHPSLDGRP
jgi:hypothetical protein